MFSLLKDLKLPILSLSRKPKVMSSNLSQLGIWSLIRGGLRLTVQNKTVRIFVIYSILCVGSTAAYTSLLLQGTVNTNGTALITASGQWWNVFASFGHPITLATFGGFEGMILMATHQVFYFMGRTEDEIDKEIDDVQDSEKRLMRRIFIYGGCAFLAILEYAVIVLSIEIAIYFLQGSSGRSNFFAMTTDSLIIIGIAVLAKAVSFLVKTFTTGSEMRKERREKKRLAKQNNPGFFARTFRRFSSIKESNEEVVNEGIAPTSAESEVTTEVDISVDTAESVTEDTEVTVEASVSEEAVKTSVTEEDNVSPGTK